jgi:hypothetical protein
MERFSNLPIVLAIASIAAFCLPVEAQTAQDISAAGFTVKPVTEVPRPMPFPPPTGDSGRAQSIEFLTVDQMTERDRELEADAEGMIGERAGFAGLEFNQGKWSYRQIACPALPNHLFLRFTRNLGAGDVSLFSASIPRNGEGRVRIIPIQRRSYSLFSPAPINALTIAAFNRIRAEERRAGTAPEWLGTGLCYAALAGAHPQVAPPADESGSQEFPAAPPAVLEIPNRGGAIIRFTDVVAARRPMEWTMTFDGKGKLLKATHLPASLVTEKEVHPEPVDERGRPRQ